jgi:uncharacterized cupredoxin-like copper-binding protein
MRRLLFLIPAALLLTACGGSGDEGSNEAGGTTSGGSVIQTIQLSEKEFSINPNTVTLTKPGTYEFDVTNDGTITHALQIEESEGGMEVESGEISPGESKTVRFTFSGDGSFEMYCPIGSHEDQGMKGTINVGGAASGGGGTTTDEDKTTTSDDDGPGY